jgi:transposase
MANDKFTIQEKAKCVCWFEELQSATKVQRRFRTEFGDDVYRMCPSKRTIRRWHEKFFETGTILRSTMTRGKTVRTTEKENVIINAFRKDPHLSLRRAANAFSISKDSVRGILKDHDFFPYKMQTHQQLFEEDKEDRRSFACDELQRIQEDSEHLQNLLFSDEAHFHLHGEVNRHNCRYWTDENPGWYSEEPVHSPRVTVWAAIGKTGIIGPFFFEGNVTGASYLQLLKNKFFPAIQRFTDPCYVRFMQDGAPAHFACAVRSWLNEKFKNRWIGRSSPNMPWPARSPDLTPMDFFLWGYIKSLVYTSSIASLDMLKARIRNAFKKVTEQMRHEAILAYCDRLQRCVDIKGGHIEMTYI